MVNSNLKESSLCCSMSCFGRARVIHVMRLVEWALRDVYCRSVLHKTCMSCNMLMSSLQMLPAMPGFNRQDMAGCRRPIDIAGGQDLFGFLLCCKLMPSCFALPPTTFLPALPPTPQVPTYAKGYQAHIRCAVEPVESAECPRLSLRPACKNSQTGIRRCAHICEL